MTIQWQFSAQLYNFLHSAAHQNSRCSIVTRNQPIGNENTTVLHTTYVRIACSLYCHFKTPFDCTCSCCAVCMHRNWFQNLYNFFLLYAIENDPIFSTSGSKNAIRTLFLIDATVTERCLSSTAGHIDVGGRIKLANFPNEHSVFTDAAQRLCNYQFFQLKMFFFCSRSSSALRSPSRRVRHHFVRWKLDEGEKKRRNSLEKKKALSEKVN